MVPLLTLQGLYESVPDVEVGDTEQLGRAVSRVWASLYTKRAVLTRRAAGGMIQNPYVVRVCYIMM